MTVLGVDGGIARHTMQARRNGDVADVTVLGQMHNDSHAFCVASQCASSVVGWEQILAEASKLPPNSITLFKTAPNKIAAAHMMAQHNLTFLLHGALDVFLEGIGGETRAALKALAARIAKLPAEELIKPGMFEPDEGNALSAADVSLVMGVVDDFAIWLRKSAEIQPGKFTASNGDHNTTYVAVQAMSMLYAGILHWQCVHNGHGALDEAMLKELLPIYARTVVKPDVAKAAQAKAAAAAAAGVMGAPVGSDPGSADAAADASAASAATTAATEKAVTRSINYGPLVATTLIQNALRALRWLAPWC